MTFNYFAKKNLQTPYLENEKKSSRRNYPRMFQEPNGQRTSNQTIPSKRI